MRIVITDEADQLTAMMTRLPKEEHRKEDRTEERGGLGKLAARLSHVAPLATTAGKILQTWLRHFASFNRFPSNPNQLYSTRSDSSPAFLLFRSLAGLFQLRSN